MKRRLIICGCICTMCSMQVRAQSAADNEGARLPVAQVRTEVQRHACLKVQMTLCLDSLRMKRSGWRRFTPVLTDGTNRMALRPITVNGKWRQVVYLRERKETGKDAYVVECGRHGAGSVEYEDSCAYSAWMKEAGLWLAEDVCGCSGDVLKQSLRPLVGKVGIASMPTEATMPVETTAADLPVSERRDTIEMNGNENGIRHKVAEVILHPDYPTSASRRAEIQPDFGNNRKELQRLETILDSLLARPQASVELIEIIGYTSPEGPYQENEVLAYKRTLALRSYLQENTRYRELPYRTASVAEDWEGLKLALEASDMTYQEELLMIIATRLPPDKKEENIRKLDAGKAYKLLEQNILPRLTRTVCKIHYTEEGQ